MPEKDRTTHIAGVKSGKKLSLFVDGSLVSTRDFSDQFLTAGNSLLQLKGIGSLTREVRISKVARYTANFVSADRFQTDADTLVLYHMDEGSGDVLTDSSGNKHHGKIVRAKWVKVEPPPPANYALEFEGSQKVLLDSMRLPLEGPVTLEATVEFLETVAKDGIAGNVVGSGQHLNLYYQPQLRLIFGAKASTGIQRADGGLLERLRGRRVRLAGVLDANELRIFVDGKRLGKSAIALPLVAPIEPFLIGGNFRGVIDEVRVSKLARYSTDYVPSERLQADEHTLALYHFDEGTGSELKDSSGNGHHGKIVGAKWVRLSEGSPAEVTPKVASGSTKREFASDEWIDVLPLIDPALDKSGVGVQWGRNDWRMEGGELRYRGDDKWGKLFFPIRYRGRSLEWELEFTRTSSGSGFTTDVPLPGGFKGISVSSDRLSFANQTPNQPFQVVNGQRMKMRFQVRHDGTNDAVDIFVNDKLALHWDGQLDKIKNAASPSELRDQSEHNGLFMAGNSDYTFHAIRVRMLNGGTAELLRPAVGSAATSPFSDAALTPYDLWTSADYEWTAPENLGPVVNSSDEEASPCLSADGLTLLFEASRAGGQGFSDLWMCRRPTVTAPWSAPENLGPNVNSKASDTQPSLSADGLTLVFASDHAVAGNEFHLWMCTRATTADPWSPRQKLQSTLDVAGASDRSPELSADELSLYFNARGRPGLGENDLWWCRRRARTGSWEMPENLGPTVNSDKEDGDPAVSSDGRVLVLASNRPDGKLRKLWWSSRSSVDAPWSAAQKISRPIDGGFDTYQPTLSSDGQTMIFATYNRTGGQGKADIWQTRRVLTPAAAARAAAANTFTNTLGMEFVRVPKGKSWLGGGGGKPGTQEVTIPDDFFLGKYEVTQEEWEKVMGKNPSHHSRMGKGNDQVKDITDADLKRFPVENLSWADCQKFVAALNETVAENGWTYRLPTEVEWEYACRGGPIERAESAFDYYLEKPMNGLPPDQAQYNKGIKGPCKVGSYPSNRLGLCDMHGNVWEWCGGSIGEGPSRRVMARSGGFFNAQFLRAADHDVRAPWAQDGLAGTGLRVARVPIAAKLSPFVSLFNGTDLTGWTKENTGKAEVVMEDGQPTLRLTEPVTLSRPIVGDYHLRFECKLFASEYGGGLRLIGEPNQLFTLGLGGDFRTPAVSSHGYIYQSAKIQAGQIVSVGQSFGDGSSLRLTNVTLDATTPWQRIEVIRLGDSFVFQINGKITGAITNLRQLRDGKPELPKTTASLILWAFGGPAQFRNIELREINALPPEVLNQNAAAWQPLFNGNDLTGLRQRTANGIAEVVVEDGQPILKLQNRSNLTTRRFGDYHLRLEFRPEKGSKVRPFSDSVSAQLMVNLEDDLSKANLNGTEMTYEAATISSGRFVGNGQTIDSKLHPYPDPLGRLTFTNATLNPNTPWQRLEIIRLGDSCAVLLNGKLVAAATNIRITRPGEPPKIPGTSEIGLTSYGGTASYRNIEIREITSLPPEIAP